jgi:hypothetical protein
MRRKEKHLEIKELKPFLELRIGLKIRRLICHLIGHRMRRRKVVIKFNKIEAAHFRHRPSAIQENQEKVEMNRWVCVRCQGKGDSITDKIKYKLNVAMLND